MKDTAYIALDIGGTRIKMGLIRNDELIDQHVFPAHPNQNFEGSLVIFEQEINKILAKHHLNKKLSGIGIAFAGLVDVRSKRILSTNEKYSDAPEIDIESWVKERWNTTLFIDNDARMAAVGEWKYGAAKGVDDLVMVTIGTGFGSSAIINGQLLRGKHYQAGCLGGHFTVNVNGNPCNCGNIGCAEAHSSSWSIVDRAQNDLDFQMSKLAKTTKIDFLEIFSAAALGDSLAQTIKQECLDVWSANIVNLIHAYDPEMIVLGGGVLKSKDEILPYVQKYVQKHAWTPWGAVKIEESQLKNNAAIFGLNYCLQHKL